MGIISKVYELTEAYNLIIREEVLNDVPGSHEIVAKTLVTAVSPGTETAAFMGAPPLRPSKVYPRLLGYCNVARVLFSGESTGIKPGSVILTFQAHRSHFVCEASEIIMVLKPEDDIKAIVTTYLFHLGYAALLSGSYQPGHNIAIVGIGTLGYTTAMLARVFGSNPLLLSNQSKALKNLQQEGFQTAPKNIEFSKSASLFLNFGSIDTVINTSNKWADWKLAMQLPRYGGTIVNLGFPGRDESAPNFNPLDSQYTYDKQLTICFAGYIPDVDVPVQDIRFTVGRNMEYLAGLIRSKKLNPYKIISAEKEWTELATVYTSILETKKSIYTVILNWA